MESTMEYAVTTTVAPTETETFQTLVARAHRKTGAVTPDVVVRHVLSITGEATGP